jgi:hypothetical protein
MSRHSGYLPQGVIRAVLLPFKDDLSIDEASFRNHLRDVASTEGLSAISINAHSTEVASCTIDEQRSMASMPMAAWKPHASPGERRTEARRRCWFSRPRRSPGVSIPKWPSPISGTSPMPATFR